MQIVASVLQFIGLLLVSYAYLRMAGSFQKMKKIAEIWEERYEAAYSENIKNRAVLNTHLKRNRNWREIDKDMYRHFFGTLPETAQRTIEEQAEDDG